MLVTPMALSLTLTKKLEKTDRRLWLTDSDEALLSAAVPDGDHTWLVIRDPAGAEVIKVENTCSTLLITRGEDGTDPRTFPRGSCIRFETVPAIVKDLICTYDCCEGECDCLEVEAVGTALPGGTVGNPWLGTAVFSGDLPMAIAVSGLPSWATIETGANYASISGTPTGAGTFTLSFAATNCDGAVAVQQGTFTVA